MKRSYNTYALVRSIEKIESEEGQRMRALGGDWRLMPYCASPFAIKKGSPAKSKTLIWRSGEQPRLASLLVV